jgi:nucleoside-triphosphatase THEP1
MNNTHGLSEKWIKASILGTIWAAFEIVLGSFLHNLKVPFSGNILTAIAIIILISVSHVWAEKGLFWRTGLICALLKTMSPSAVIFGPMIAIITEAFLIEFSVRVFGRTYVGYAVGAMLAMSWNLFQKIANYVIFYGFNILEIYGQLIKYAQKQLNIQFDLLWTPLIVLLIIYALLGLVAAIIGIRAGRKFVKQPAENKAFNFRLNSIEKKEKTPVQFSYSVTWLIGNIIMMIGSLVLLNIVSWQIWTSAITVIVLIWAFRYKRALRQLSKPKLWIFFVVLTMSTTLVFAWIGDETISTAQALLIGLQMNFRAIVIIVGFTVLGTELYNPAIRAFFMKTSFRKLPLALEMSFESLPLMIAQIPDVKSIIKNPTSIIYQAIMLAEHRLAELKKPDFIQKIFILTGEQGGGKTTCLQGLLVNFRERNMAVGGIISPRIIENNETTAYDIIDVATHERESFLRLADIDAQATIGKYRMITQGWEFGCKSLNSANNLNNKIVLIDEVGKLELNNLGWAQSIQELLHTSGNHLLLVVRKPFVESVIQKWNLNPCFVYDISEFECQAIDNQIVKEMEK